MSPTARAIRPSIRIFLSLVLLLSVVQPASAAPAVDPLVLSTALEYRRTFGFSTDIADVTATELDPRASRKYSVALTPAETEEMDRRMAIQEALVPLVKYGLDRPDAFGGIYVDQANGGVVHFAFTADIDAHRASLEAMAPAGAEIVVRQVALTEVELDALTDHVSRDLDFHAAVGTTVYSVAPTLLGTVSMSSSSHTRRRSTRHWWKGTVQQSESCQVTHLN